MAGIFTKNAGPKALVTVIRLLVSFERTGMLQLGQPELSPGVSYDGLEDLVRDPRKLVDRLEEMADDYEATIPTNKDARKTANAVERRALAG